MDLYHKWDVKNDFAYVLQFLSLISDSLGSVTYHLSTFFLVIEVGHLSSFEQVSSALQKSLSSLHE